MNRPRRDRRWQTPRDRAKVAAELIEEAESLSETALIATPADLAKATRPKPIQVTPASPPAAATPATASSTRTPARRPAPEPRREPDRETALATVNDALSREPGAVPHLLERATLHSAMGNYTPARHDLERVIALEPGNVEALTQVGILLSRRGLWADAAAQLRRAVAADSGRADAWYYLGEALNHIDDLAGALTAYTCASELQPENPRAFHGQGIVLDRLNRPDDATRMYRRARELSRR